MKIYVVKYALTEGIKEIEAQFSTSTTKKGAIMQYEITLEAARAKAYAMRDKKIASLKKQIAKLEKMEF